VTDDKPAGGAYPTWAPTETEESRACKAAWQAAYDAARAAGKSEKAAQVAGAKAHALKQRELRGLPAAEPDPYDDASQVPAWRGKGRRKRR
jgi:hypothetical protein